MTLVERVGLTSSQASITFSNIPQDGTDLCLVVSARSARGPVFDDMKIEFNGVNTNQSVVFIYGNGTSVATSFDSLIYSWINGDGSTANTFGSNQIYIPNYAGNTAKVIAMDALTEGNQATAYSGIYSALWNSTAAITSLLIKPFYGGVFLSGTTATLYKITKGSDGTTTAA